jgi:Lrp/AsnC family leucine-responsive transcriptional regulator
MDAIDKELVNLLGINGRLSYQSLARRVGLTIKGVKKRVEKLFEVGILGRPFVALIGSRYGIITLSFLMSTDGSEDKETFIQQLGDTGLIHSVAVLVDGRYMGGARVSRPEEVLQLERIFQRNPCVTQVEIHHSRWVHPSTQKFHIDQIRTKDAPLTFSKLQKKVLRCLVEDVRMPATEIAQRTNLTPKRVRKVINELATGGNVFFSFVTTPGAGEDFDCYIKTTFDPQKGNPVELVDWFRDQYPVEHWWTLIHVDESILRHKLLVNDLRIIEEITDLLKHIPMVESVETLIYHTVRTFPWLNEILLKQMLDEPDK